MNDPNNLPTPGWHPEPPAAPDALEVLLLGSGLNLPQDYLRFLRCSNGGEGELGVHPGWFSLWPAEEVLELNQSIEVQKWLPGFFGFGSNGGRRIVGVRRAQNATLADLCGSV